MRVTLPGNHWAEFRDTLLRGDTRDARKGMQFVIAADGSRTTDGSFLDTVTGNIITTMLTGWDLDLPLPSAAATRELQQQILDKIDEDTYAALEKAVGPWVERVMRRKSDTTVFLHRPSGVQVEVADPVMAAKLAQFADFARVDDDADPKSASAPTAISSSEPPADAGSTTSTTTSTSS